MAEVFDEEKQHDLWSNVPLDLLNLIQSYLFIERDFNIFGLICKSWKNASIQQFLLPTDYSRVRNPLLMSMHGGKCNFLDPLQHHSYHMHIPELSNNQILYSKFGWLLIWVREDLSIFFFNPITRMRVDLPNLGLLPDYGPRLSLSSAIKFSFGFSGLPTSRDCVVIGVHGSKGCMIRIIAKPGVKNWHLKCTYSTETFDMCSNPIFVDGSFYCLSVDGKLSTCDPKAYMYPWDFLGDFLGKRFPKRYHYTLMGSFMVEGDGEMFVVFLTCFGKVLVYKLHSSKKDWIKVDDLGNKVLYVSNGASWAEVSGGASRNKIYFPMLYEDKTLVFYNLTTRRFHSNGYDFSGRLHSNADEFWGTDFERRMKLLSNSTWIKPT